MINDLKMSNETRLTQLENNQITFGMNMISLENIQATMGTCKKNMEHNQANIGTCMKNMEMNLVNLGASLKNLETQMGQLAQSLRENSPKSFLSDTKKNMKQCMIATLRSGKELDEPKKIEDAEKQVQQKILEFGEKMEAEIDKEGAELNNKGKKQKSDKVVSRRMNFLDNPPFYTPPLPFLKYSEKLS